MAKDIVNLYAESDRGIISDDTSSAITIENTNTGSAIVAKNSLACGSTQSPTFVAQIAATAPPTIAVIRTLNSVASGPHLEFQGFLASIASLTSITRAVRVKFGDNYGWIPIYMSATYI